MTVYLVMGHHGTSWLCLCYSLTYITLTWSWMGDWIITMSLQTTLVKACSLNQTSCHSPQFQIGTVTLVSQCHVLTYRQSRDRRLVYFRMGTFCNVGVARGRPSCFGHACCRAASVLPPWNSRCKIELIFGVMLQFNVVWCIHSRPRNSAHHPIR